MKKDLPKPKRNLKSFILDEDAKVVDRTAVRVALSGSFMALVFLSKIDDAHAKGHQNHSNHQNALNAPNHYGTGIHAGNNPRDVVVNQIESERVLTMHSNHYNHTDESGSQSWTTMLMDAFLGFPAFIGAIDLVSGMSMFEERYYEEEDIQAVNTGTPYVVPEFILEILREQED